MAKSAWVSFLLTMLQVEDLIFTVKQILETRGLGSFHRDKSFHLKEEFTTSLWRVEKSSIPALTGLSLNKIKFYLNPI